MTIVISLACDECDDYVECSASFDSGVSEIEGSLDEGWEHGPDGDFCPDCAKARR